MIPKGQQCRMCLNLFKALFFCSTNKHIAQHKKLRIVQSFIIIITYAYINLYITNLPRSKQVLMHSMRVNLLLHLIL